MTAASLLDRITFTPGICRGRACVSGTRIPVSVVLDNLADGEDFASISKAYPPLSEADIRACLAYAAKL
jgi:uncharacterized protein (DUF433 family)